VLVLALVLVLGTPKTKSCDVGESNHIMAQQCPKASRNYGQE
jgi:hypothetical protein